MLFYVRYLAKNDRWAEIARDDDGNSHYPQLSSYQRLLTRYRSAAREAIAATTPCSISPS
jgi:uncharacterized protein YfbU (UPF0304 family)